jgi:hypothetical protein
MHCLSDNPAAGRKMGSNPIASAAFLLLAQSEEVPVPAKSAAQQKAAGAALSAKRGETPKTKLKGASKQMVDSMSEKQLEEFAHTKRKGKPEHVAK